MFWDDIKLVTEQIEKYGLRSPMLDLSGNDRPSIQDFEVTSDSKILRARTANLTSRPFDHITHDYTSISCKAGRPNIEEILSKPARSIGTAVCIDALQRIDNPFELFSALSTTMMDDSLLIISSLFSHPHDTAKQDLWRFSPECLKSIANKFGFTVLECDWRLNIKATNGQIDTADAYDLRSVYITLTRGNFIPKPSPGKFTLPQLQFGDCSSPTPIHQSPLPQVKISSARKGLSCLFLNSYYDGFLENFYSNNPDIAQLPYNQQLERLQSEAFGDSDFYSENLKACGWNADNLIVNAQPLQQAWAREHGVGGDGLTLALKQIEHVKPDVLYTQDMHSLNREFLAAARKHVKLIVGQHASSLNFNQIPVDAYDIIFTSIQSLAEHIRKSGVIAYYQPLAFEASLLEKHNVKAFSERTHAISFVGGLASKVHSSRQVFLEQIASETDTQFWGYGFPNLPPESKIRNKYHGEAWGNPMFSVLFDSKMTVNSHGEVWLEGGPVTSRFNAVQHFANNMRLFEATGCGALLITDYRDNLSELFEIGKEIVAYRSTEECLALMQYYSQNPAEAEKIALAGQARTLKDHTYQRRMQQTAEILERHLRYEKEKEFASAPDLNNISTNYRSIDRSQVSDELLTFWKHPAIARKQRDLVQTELAGMYKGRPAPPYITLANILTNVVKDNSSVLEIGCSSGYYYEILEYLLGKRIDYCGVDYSAPMIEMAKDYYPKPRFEVADGAHLPFKDKSFDCVISSCVILHTPNYREQIAESVRVLKKTFVLHRTPICRRRPTQFFSKEAYGQPTVELLFNEQEIADICFSHGLRFVGAIQVDGDDAADNYCVSYMFERP